MADGTRGLEFRTLGTVIATLERLTGRRVALEEVLEVERDPN